MFSLISQTNIGGFQGIGSRFEPVINPGEAQGQRVVGIADKTAQIISMAIGSITILVAFAFLMYFTLGGFQWITAGADKQKLDMARDRMTNALIGLIITIASYSIIALIGVVFDINFLNIREMLCNITQISTAGCRR